MAIEIVRELADHRNRHPQPLPKGYRNEIGNMFSADWHVIQHSLTVHSFFLAFLSVHNSNPNNALRRI